MNEEDKKIYNQMDGQNKALFQLLRRYIDSKVEEITTTIASLDAHLITVTNSETFQKIIADELEKSVKEKDNG